MRGYGLSFIFVYILPYGSACSSDCLSKKEQKTQVSKMLSPLSPPSPTFNIYQGMNRIH